MSEELELLELLSSRGWRYEHQSTTPGQGFYFIYDRAGKLVGVGHTLEDAIKDAEKVWD